jgi:hypothetical protein
LERPTEHVGSRATRDLSDSAVGARGDLGTGSQLFTQDTPGVGSTAEELDAFGQVLDARSD